MNTACDKMMKLFTVFDALTWLCEDFILIRTGKLENSSDGLEEDFHLTGEGIR